jgi:hypothetical protein
MFLPIQPYAIKISCRIWLWPNYSIGWSYQDIEDPMSFVTAQSSHPPGSVYPPKFVIPHLDTAPQHFAKRRRALTACTSCRRRRVKCDGGEPNCEKCQNCPQPCVYEKSRSVRLKMSVAHWSALPVTKDWSIDRATDRIDKMKALLQNMRVLATDQDKQRIDNVLAQVRFDFRYSSHPI